MKPPRIDIATIGLVAALALPGAYPATAQEDDPDDSRFLFSVYWGPGGAAVGESLRDAMAQQGFDDDRTSLTTGGQVTYPRKDGVGFATVLSAYYVVKPPFAVGAVYGLDNQLGEAVGHRAPGFLVTADARTDVMALMGGVQIHNVRLAVGPARFGVTGRVSSEGADINEESVAGALAEAAFGLPLVPGVLRIEVLGQYRLVGDLTVGPHDVRGDPGTTSFSPVTVGLRNWYVGAGLSVRF